MGARYVYVLGVDPGTTTGLAVARFDVEYDGRPSSTWADQLEWHEACGRVEWALETMRKRLDTGEALACHAVREQYIINANTAQRGQQGADDALGMNGVVRRNAMLTKIDCPAPQQASAAKKLVPDDALKRLSLYAPGMGHVNDAYRHVILFAVKQKIMAAGWLVTGLPRPNRETP